MAAARWHETQQSGLGVLSSSDRSVPGVRSKGVWDMWVALCGVCPGPSVPSDLWLGPHLECSRNMGSWAHPDLWSENYTVCTSDEMSVFI